MIGSPMNFFDVSGGSQAFQTGAMIGRGNSPFPNATEALRDVIRRGQQFSQTMAEQELKKQLVGYEYGLKNKRANTVFDYRDEYKPYIDPETGAVVVPKINATDQGIFVTNEVSGEGSPFDRELAARMRQVPAAAGAGGGAGQDEALVRELQGMRELKAQMDQYRSY